MLVILFYVFVFTNTILNAFMALIDLDNSQSWEFTSWFTYLNALKSLNLACTYLTDGLTMFYLAITVRLMLKKITKQMAMLFLKIVFAVATILILSYIPLAFTFKERKQMHELRVVVDLTILFVNGFILYFLRIQLSLFGVHNMKSSIRSVNQQFLVFLLAYAILCFGDIYFGLLYPNTPFFLDLLMNFFEKTIILVPINYVIYIHRETFKNEQQMT